MVCSSGVGFDPTVRGEQLTFRVAGLYNGVFTMWDRETNSAWSHLDGRAIAGELRGEQLAIRPLQTTTWEAWLTEHPNTTVPDVNTGARYHRGPQVLGRTALTDTFLATLPVGLDGRLPAHDVVVGVLVGTEARAYPRASRPGDAPFQDTVAGVPIVILEDRNGDPVLAYHRALNDGRVLDFVRGPDGQIFDQQTGSRWSGSGVATEGELRGVQLTFVTSFVTEYYGWWAFHPETSIHGQDH